MCAGARAKAGSVASEYSVCLCWGQYSVCVCVLGLVLRLEYC